RERAHATRISCSPRSGISLRSRGRPRGCECSTTARTPMYWWIESCSGIEPRARERWRRVELWADRLSLVCFGVLALVMIATLPDYGLTYDEEPHVRLGERVLW